MLFKKCTKNLLNDNEAQEAINAKLDNGELKSWQKPNALTSPVTYNYSPISMYRNKLDYYISFNFYSRSNCSSIICWKINEKAGETNFKYRD